MDGEEESSLDVTGDEIDFDYEERPVNCYGSPIALPESTDHEEAGPSQALPGRVVSANEARMSNFYYRFVGYKRLRFALLSTLYRSVSLPVQEYLQPKNRKISGMCVQGCRSGMCVQGCRSVMLGELCIRLSINP